MFERIGRKRPKMFGVLDMTSEYWQAPLSERSKNLTTFISAFGVFEWNRVVIRLKSASSFFHRAMATGILPTLIHEICEVYLDDLIVHGPTTEDFFDSLDRVLKRCIQFNVTLNPTKCRLGVTEIEYVGHTIDAAGHHHFSREKLDHVKRMPLPHTHGELRAFLGLSNYFRDHVRDYATLTAPLHSILTEKTSKCKHGPQVSKHPKKSNYNKHKVIVWTDDLRTCFEDVKEAINSCPKLNFVDDFSEVHVYTDASEIGYGAYLCQLVRQSDDTLKEVPILFLSKGWIKEQKRWSTPEKEAYAIFYALRKWEHMLRDSKFVLHTDHRNLVFLNTSGSAKVKRWKLLVQDYDCLIEYIKGPENVVADGFSRCCQTDAETFSAKDEESYDLFVRPYSLMLRRRVARVYTRGATR